MNQPLKHSKDTIVHIKQKFRKWEKYLPVIYLIKC